MINIYNISENDKHVFLLTNEEYSKMTNVIKKMQEKYSYIVVLEHKIESKHSIKFDFEEYINDVLNQKRLIINIINDVILEYNKEMKNLECLFLSGSYSRGTNKMSSDIDLHFFYKKGIYNFKYEEIVCYIISCVINKSRDCIDPTFIFNLNQNYKKYVTKKMNNKKLNIYLKSNESCIKYSFKPGKKRRFYLQYNNSRNLKKLFKYLYIRLNEKNLEWLHCFEIIYGKEKFDKMYSKLYNREKELINKKYIKERIENLILNLKELDTYKGNMTIGNIKEFYQSKIFELIYEYISIIRFVLIYNNNNVMKINILDMYDYELVNKEVIKQIYNYMWNLRNFTVYCYKNNINYGLHNFEIVNYDFNNMNNSIKVIKKSILYDLIRIGEIL